MICLTRSAAALVLLLLGSVHARATVIYSDSFNRTGILNGSAPDVTNVPGQNWIADVSVTTDGSRAADPHLTSAWLPVTIAANNIYTLQADLDVVRTTDGSWMSLAFSPTGNTGFGISTNPSVGPWTLQRGDGLATDGGDGLFAGPGTTNVQTIGAGNTGVQTWKIVLDTMAAQWTATFYRDNAQVGMTYTYGTNPSGLSYVGFHDINNDGGFVDNFSFADAVEAIPEPSTFVLASLGLLSLGLRRRRRRLQIC
jgi:hypothetical protein